MQLMPSGPGARSTSLIRVVFLLYATFLVVSPFEHHSLQCELQTPLHCTACATSALGSTIQTADVGGSWHPDDGGSAVREIIVLPEFVLDLRSNGRAPPRHA